MVTNHSVIHGIGCLTSVLFNINLAVGIKTLKFEVLFITVSSCLSTNNGQKLRRDNLGQLCPVNIKNLICGYLRKISSALNVNYENDWLQKIVLCIYVPIGQKIFTKCNESRLPTPSVYFGTQCEITKWLICKSGDVKCP